MNFRDAAIKVLTENKKPLHYKKITAIAVKEKFLDFLGTSPEKRMLDSLKLEVKKKDAQISVVRPGFFILKEYHNKNIKKKDDKPQKRLEKLKEKKKKDETTYDEIKNISEYSKQIYSKQYFTEGKAEENEFKLTDKNQIPQLIFNILIKRKKVKYYTMQEIIHIIEKEKIFDIANIIPDELVQIFVNYNKQGKDGFLINDNKIVPYALLESKELTKNTSRIFSELKQRNELINKEVINWFNRLNFGQFKKFSEIFLKKLDLYAMKPIKGISGYYFLSKKLGLSVINFILYIKKGREDVTRQNIIEARGVLSRFGYGNLIILTSSKFDSSAIEETKLNGTNIILMDKYFIFDMMKEFEIGIKKESGIYNVDYDFFLTL